MRKRRRVQWTKTSTTYCGMVNKAGIQTHACLLRNCSASYKLMLKWGFISSYLNGQDRRVSSKLVILNISGFQWKKMGFWCNSKKTFVTFSMLQETYKRHKMHFSFHCVFKSGLLESAITFSMFVLNANNNILLLIKLVKQIDNKWIILELKLQNVLYMNNSTVILLSL